MRLSVRVKPGASRTRVGGRYGQVGDVLEVAVAARAVEGAANEAVLAAVAGAFGLRPRQVHLRQGRRSRTKTLELDIEDAQGRKRLLELLEG